MTFPVKEWENRNASMNTPIDADALKDLETRLSGYTDTSLAHIIPSVLDRGIDNVGLVDQASAIAALEPGTYTLPPDGFIRLATDAVVPPGVNFIGQGQGYDEDDWEGGSVFRCTTSFGRLTFADGYGGLSSNFMVDGGGIATNSMKLNICINRTFINVMVRDSTGDNLVLNGSQNNTFHRLESLRAGAACVVLDNSAGSNYFHDSELYSPGTYHIVSRQSMAAVNPTIGTDYPLNNVFDGGIAEYSTTTTRGCVFQSAGNHLRFTGGFNFSPGDASAYATPATFHLENQSPAMSVNGGIVVDGILAFGGGTRWRFLDVISVAHNAVMIICGYNYVENFEYGLKFAAGVLIPVRVDAGYLEMQVVTTQYSHAGGAAEYAIVYGFRQQGVSYNMNALDDPTVRVKRRVDVADRVQVRPDGMWMGAGVAGMDTGVGRAGVSAVQITSALTLNGSMAAGDVPLYSFFIDATDLVMKYKGGSGTITALGPL